MITARLRRHRALLGGLIRYALVGVANAAVYYLTYLAVLGAVGYLLAHVIGLGVAMVVSFLLNCRFTFRVRPTLMRLLLYPASQVVNIAATTVGVVALVHLGVDERLAPLVAAALAVPASYLAARTVMTRTRPRTAPTSPRPSSAGDARAPLVDAVTMPLFLRDARR